MAQTLPTARESVPYYQSFTFAPESLNGDMDLTGYTFDLVLTRQIGMADITLTNAAAPMDEGFEIVSASGLIITIRIEATTLAAVTDTTGDYELFGDLIATPPAGDSFLVADLILPITKGPTAP